MSEPSLGAAEALASIAMVAIAADGYLADQEGQDMTMLLSRMALFSNYSSDALHHLFDTVLDRLKTEGPGVLVDQAKTTLSQEMRETAFAIATDLVLSDRTVTPQEQAFLEDLYRILEIPSPLAQQIVQVMTIKNRG
jgi:tellurite resistance protein